MKGYAVSRFRLPGGESPAYYGSDVIVRIEEDTEVIDGETVAVRWEVVYRPIPEAPPVQYIPEDATDEERDTIATCNMNSALVWTRQHLSMSEKQLEKVRPYVKRGVRVVEGASKGGRSRSKWPERAEELQQAIDSIYAQHPEHSYTRIMEIATQRRGYPKSALKRYTQNPHRK